MCHHDSPYLFQPLLVEPNSSSSPHKRARTAPASPIGVGSLTPHTSPLLNKASIFAAAAAPPAPLPVVVSAPTSVPANFPSPSGPAPAPLPSLRHLRLLPDPRVQEHAYYFPDTSEHTPIWRENLLAWCKNQNYNDYLHISREVEHSLRSPTGLNVLANIASISQLVPSVLNPKDQFYDLSNSEGVVTPPLSPHYVTTAARQPLTFNSIVSDKLVQAIKQRRSGSHKKTNSFKAREMKKLLNNRDILSVDSKGKVEKPARKRNPSSPQHFIMKISSLSPIKSSGSGMKNTPSKSSPPSSTVPSTNTSNFDNFLSFSSTPLLSTPASNGPSSSAPPYSRTPHSSYQSSSFPSSSIPPSGSAPPSRIPATNDPPPSNYRLTSAATPRRSSRPNSPTREGSPPGSRVLKLNEPRTPTSMSSYRISNSTAAATAKASPAEMAQARKPPSPKRVSHRICISCLSSDSPCWRPSWTNRKQDQLCNSCGLRYKKTRTRCLNDSCRKIPSKGELAIMKANARVTQVNDNATVTEGLGCLFCNNIVETKENTT